MELDWFKAYLDTRMWSTSRFLPRSTRSWCMQFLFLGVCRRFTNGINSDLQELSLWLQGNKLTLNGLKTHSSIFGTEPILRMIYRYTSTTFILFQIFDDENEYTDNIKYVGLEIDPPLNWKEQITTIISKISRGIGILKYPKRYFPLHTIQRMHNSIVDPHLRCCCSVC